MQGDIAATIYERAKVLPVESQRVVLTFIDDLESRSSQNGSSIAGGLDQLWKDLDEIVAHVPDEAWDEVPTDGAVNHDHYLYGAPKRYK